jgi:hypothetical protein
VRLFQSFPSARAESTCDQRSSEWLAICQRREESRDWIESLSRCYRHTDFHPFQVVEGGWFNHNHPS